ncbi:hypothetical protein B0H11DRAFT_2089780 [Mycena galericulata]|nr:hypothetical protein B0H11DRAFT_2089780 [Mycena galericulata]
MLTRLSSYYWGSRRQAYKEPIWAQMLYVGSPRQWMTPDRQQDERQDVLEKYHFSTPTPPNMLLEILSQSPTPWPHYTAPFLPVLPPSRSSSSPPSQARVEISPQRAVFRHPTLEERTAHLKAEEQRICDAADGCIALPGTPPLRVFIPQPIPRPSTSTSTTRSPSPFRMIPCLRVRFPQFFGSGAEAEAEVDSERTFSGSTDSDLDEREAEVEDVNVNEATDVDWSTTDSDLDEWELCDQAELEGEGTTGEQYISSM